MTQLTSPVALARRLHESGQLEQARALYKQAIEVEPDNLEATYLLGILHSRLGDLDEAASALTAATQIDPRNAAAPFALGRVLMQQGRLNDAIARFRRAIKLNPTLAEAHAGLGAALQRKGRLDDAAAALHEAIRLEPQLVEAIINIGSISHQQRRFDEAERWYRHALEFDPRHVIALNNLGCLLNERGRFEEAIEVFERAADRAPDSADVLTNMGAAFEGLDRHDDARRCFRRACELMPENAAARIRLGTSLLRENANIEAIAQFDAALVADPENLTAGMHARLALPIMYESIDEIDRWRERYTLGLSQFSEDVQLRTSTQRAAALRALGSFSNAALINQGLNDWTLQEKFGRLACRIMAANLPKFASPRSMPALTTDGRIRVGFASTNLRRCTVGRIVSAFIEQFDRTKFEMHCYMLGRADDDITEQCRSHAARFLRPVGSIDEIAATLAGEQLHVLIYPDPGNHPITTQLGSLRLAAVQCTMWGRPTTSGLPTIDHHITSDLMEPPGAEEQYTERLIALPSLGAPISRPAKSSSKTTRAALGLPEDSPILACSHALPRLLPQHDSLFVRIADEHPQARIVFAADPCAPITEQFRSRLHQTFEQSGLNPERHVVIIQPGDSPIRRADLLDVCDVVLDSPSWSDIQMCIDALSREIPIVTLPGSLMRTRHAYAMLKLLELDELIAADESDYVQIAARLSREADFRQRIRTAIARRNHALFDDPQPVRALEAYLGKLVNRAG